MHAGAARRVLLASLASLVAVGTALTAPLPAYADEPTKVLLLLDVSGSMKEPISSGGTKFAAAKRALKKVADALPPGTEVGLRVYGSKIAEPKQRNPKACTDTELVMPIAPLDRERMYQAVDSFTAKGETPIAYSLGKAVDDLGDSGKRVLVLISDGEETCAGDPCPTARKLAKSGVDLQFNAIGLDVGGKARRQLQCIAKAGDGNYYDAGNTSELEEAVRRITQRALRPFQTTGTPVRGTPDRDGAPTVRPGQYKDTYDASGTARFYTITRTPGSTVTASIATVVRPYPTQNTENWALSLSTRSGVPCASSQPVSGGYRATMVLGGSVSSSQVDAITRSPAPDACDTEPELVLSMARSSPLGNEDEVSVELLITEEPAIANLVALPEPVTGYTGTASAVRASNPAKPILGGTSFSNSTELSLSTEGGRGSWRDSIATGETVFYRIRLEPGQRLRATATAPAPKTGWRLGAAEAVTTRMYVFSPARVALVQRTAILQGRSTVDLTVASPQVRVRNREVPPPVSWLEPNVATAATAGDYFVAFQLDPLQADLSGRVMQLRLSLAIDGEPAGLPDYAANSPAPTPTGSASASPTEPSSRPATPTTDPAEGDPAPGVPIGLAAGGALLAAGLIGAGVWWNRRQRRARRLNGGPS